MRTHNTIEIEQVLDNVITAFSGLTVPDRDSLIGDFDFQQSSEAEEFRAAIAGRSWQSLDDKFIRRNWTGYMYLSPVGYRYYLPAQIVCSVHALQAGDEDLLHSVMLNLQPEFPAICAEGYDPYATSQQSLLSDNQYLAMCAFLGLIVERQGRVGHIGAQALYWRWNRIETACHQVVRENRESLRSYIRPEPQDLPIRKLCGTIASAFAATPGLLKELACEPSPDPEVAEIALELRGVKWQAAHPRLLADNYSALSFLSDAGFRYFLPAYMIADLCGDDTNADPVFHLTHGLYDSRIDRIDLTAIREIVGDDGKHIRWVSVTYDEELAELAKTPERRVDSGIHGYTVNRLSSFNRAERAAIVEYLRYRAQHDEFYSERVNQAIHGYWMPSLA